MSDDSLLKTLPDVMAKAKRRLQKAREVDSRHNEEHDLVQLESLLDQIENES